jgi:hypothetical protein
MRRAEGQVGKAFSSIGVSDSIEKINLSWLSYDWKRTFRLLVLYTGVSEILRSGMTMFLSVMTQRKIIHVDCDCFYAAIEMRDDPRLAGKPWRWVGRRIGVG